MYGQLIYGETARHPHRSCVLDSWPWKGMEPHAPGCSRWTEALYAIHGRVARPNGVRQGRRCPVRQKCGSGIDALARQLLDLPAEFARRANSTKPVMKLWTCVRTPSSIKRPDA